MWFSAFRVRHAKGRVRPVAVNFGVTFDPNRGPCAAERTASVFHSYEFIADEFEVVMMKS